MLDKESVNLLHGLVELRINFFARPALPHRVLTHFHAADGDTAGVRGFPRCEVDAGIPERIDRRRRTGHVRALADRANPVADQIVCVANIEFVLDGAGYGNVAGDLPGRRLCQILTMPGSADLECIKMPQAVYRRGVPSR